MVSVQRLLGGSPGGSGSSGYGDIVVGVGVGCDTKVLGRLLLLLLWRRSVGAKRGAGNWSACLLLGRKIRSHSLDTVATLDHISLEGDGSRSAVQLEEQAACVAKNGTKFVASP